MRPVHPVEPRRGEDAAEIGEQPRDRTDHGEEHEAAGQRQRQRGQTEEQDRHHRGSEARRQPGEAGRDHPFLGHGDGQPRRREDRRRLIADDRHQHGQRDCHCRGGPAEMPREIDQRGVAVDEVRAAIGPLQRGIEHGHRQQRPDHRDRDRAFAVASLTRRNRRRFERGEGIKRNQRDPFDRRKGWHDRRGAAAVDQQSGQREHDQRRQLDHGHRPQCGDRPADPDDVERHERSEQAADHQRAPDRLTRPREKHRRGGRQDGRVGGDRGDPRDIGQPADDEPAERSERRTDVQHRPARSIEMARAVGQRQGDAGHPETGDEQQQRRETADRGIELAGQRENPGADHAVGGDQHDPDDADGSRRRDQAGAAIGHPAISRAASSA